MKSMIVVALALVAVVAAAPGQEPIKILTSNFEQQPDGPYQLSFETEDGVSRQEQGVLKQVVDEENKPKTVLTVSGSYNYPSENGQVLIKYFADETGFHAEGDSIPKPARR